MRLVRLIAAVLGLLGVASASLLLTFADMPEDYIFAVLMAIAFSCLLAVAVTRRGRNAVIAFNAVACLGILYATQAILVGFEPPRLKLLEVYRLRGEGVEAFPAAYPALFYSGEYPLLQVNGKGILPLGGLAGVTTVYCREADPFLTYRSDRYGFNNPDAIWDDTVTVALLGDSFTQGACVRPANHLAAVLREQFTVLNLGIGGDGPLTELAALREYLTHVRPKIVFWLYADNDVIRRPSETKPSDLQVELQANALLRRYLEDPAFTQNLIGLRDSVAPVYRAMLEDHVQRERAEAIRLGRLWSWWGQAAQFVTLRGLLALAKNRTLNEGARAGNATPAIQAPRLLQVFGRVLRQARREVEAWGGSLVFVYLPDHDDATGRPHEFRDLVLATARAQGLTVIDVLRVFDNVEDRNGLFAYGRHGGHYSAEGYRIVGATLLERSRDYLRKRP